MPQEQESQTYTKIGIQNMDTHRVVIPNSAADVAAMGQQETRVVEQTPDHRTYAQDRDAKIGGICADIKAVVEGVVAPLSDNDLPKGYGKGNLLSKLTTCGWEDWLRRNFDDRAGSTVVKAPGPKKIPVPKGCGQSFIDAFMKNQELSPYVTVSSEPSVTDRQKLVALVFSFNG